MIFPLMFILAVGRERKEVEEVDNEEAKAKKQQQQTPVDRAVDWCAPTCTGHRGRSPGRPQKKPVDLPVDRLT